MRLYFTSHVMGHPQESAIYSARSVDDGDTFEFEPGVRFGVAGQGIMDCAVVRLKESWHLFCPQKGKGPLHATSADGLAFTRTEDASSAGSFSWIGNVTVAGDKLRFWQGTAEGILCQDSTDGIHWAAGPQLKLPGQDPAALPLEEGRTLLLFTKMVAPGNGMNRPGQGQGRPGIPRPQDGRPEPREPDVELKRDPPPSKKTP